MLCVFCVVWGLGLVAGYCLVPKVNIMTKLTSLLLFSLLGGAGAFGSTRWEYRAFYQPLPGSTSILPHFGDPSGIYFNRTDAYWVYDEDIGIKERYATEFMNPRVTHNTGRSLDLKIREEVDKIGYEKWGKWKFENREAMEKKLKLMLPKSPVRLSLAKERTQLQVGNVLIEDTQVQAPQLGAKHPLYEWKTVAIEGKRVECELIRLKLLQFARDQAVNGTFHICGYPAFVEKLSHELTTMEWPPETEV